jgi:hypothetical protein
MYNSLKQYSRTQEVYNKITEKINKYIINNNNFQMHHMRHEGAIPHTPMLA